MMSKTLPADPGVAHTLVVLGQFWRIGSSSGQAAHVFHTKT